METLTVDRRPTGRAAARDYAAPAPEAIAEQTFRAQREVAQDAASAAGVAGEADAVTVTSSENLEQLSVVERYAPGTQLQNGPGVPNWNFQTHRLQWGGPVEPSQTMRLVVLDDALGQRVAHRRHRAGRARAVRDRALWISLVWRAATRSLAQDRACDHRNPPRGRAVAHGAGESRADTFARAARGAEAAAVATAEVRSGLRLDCPGAGRARGRCARGPTRGARAGPRAACLARGTAALATRPGADRRHLRRRSRPGRKRNAPACAARGRACGDAPWPAARDRYRTPRLPRATRADPGQRTRMAGCRRR